MDDVLPDQNVAEEDDEVVMARAASGGVLGKDAGCCGLFAVVRA
uniref:Uncharacterized protein n=1 Tax=Peronospora matthiolae TaxID=2874970 RepID=A0AAV1V3H1_9STRA